jgi:hypothetical protein
MKAIISANPHVRSLPTAHREKLINELIPSIDKANAERLSRQLSSLRDIHSIDTSKSGGDERVKDTLKQLCKKMLVVAEKQKQAQQTSVAPTFAEKTTTATSTSTKVEATLVATVSPEINMVSINKDSAAGDIKTININTAFQNVEVAEEVPSPKNNNHQAKVDRHHILINLLGETKYDEILNIANEIKTIRQQSGVWTKFSKDCSRTHEKKMECGSYEEERIPVSQSLPAPIFDLYFRVRLVDAMRVVDARSSKALRELPTSCACIVQRVDWNNLLQDAKAKLEAFRKFERENITSDDDLSFRCWGGVCRRS